jgi:quercetin dioxygenase-like cupin family protein
MSPGALSMLENDHTGVSLKRLQLIANALGVPIVQLLGEPQTTHVSAGRVQVVRNGFATVPGVSRGAGVVYQVIGLKPQRSIQPALVSFAPGAGFIGDRIAHTGEEVVFVVAGQVELHVGDEIQRLNQGDLAVYGAESPHGYKNASSTGPALILCVATPPW